MNNGNGRKAQIPPGMFLRVMQNKQDIIAYYESLHTMTSDEQVIGIIRDIIMDEMSHLDAFMNLYIDLYREKPFISDSAPPQISSFIDGVKFSILSELNLYSFYGNVFFSDQNEEVRSIFLRALFDENGHSTKFNLIYTGLLENIRHG